jgi:hypothetical protein
VSTGAVDSVVSGSVVVPVDLSPDDVVGAPVEVWVTVVGAGSLVLAGAVVAGAGAVVSTLVPVLPAVAGVGGRTLR